MKERYRELLDVNPMYKMGFKILDEKQLVNMLPTYKNLLDKFEKYRSHIEKYSQYEKKNGFDRQYNLMFDNIFSIFGKRGSGKTSAIFSLREQLMNKTGNDQDLVLPIIIPEIISEECDVMEWCLAIFEDEIDKIEKKIKANSELLNDSDFFKNCRFVQNNKLRRSFTDAKMSYFESGKIDYRADSIGASINRKATKMQSNYEFTKKFSNFLEELCITLKKTAEDSKKEPLIYIMFDDVDLTPKIVIELLSTLMKYLAYPNVIVIITADEQLIEKVIYQNISSEYPVLRKERENTIGFYRYGFEKPRTIEEDRIQSVTNAYMNKILPPSSRYYINIFNTCEEKKEFIQRTTREDTISVERFLREKVYEYQKSVKNRETKGSEYDNFLYLDQEKEKFIKSYLMFFGNTSRQIANECLLVGELLEYLGKINTSDSTNNQCRLKRFQQVQLFIKNTLENVKGILGEEENIDEFLSKTFYLQKENWDYYIDYEYVKEYYKRQINDAVTYEDTSLIIKNMTAIFHLFFFLESILRKTEENLNGEKPRIHGQRTLISFLDHYSSGDVSLLKLDQSDDRISHFLYEYSDILENPGFLRQFSVNNYNTVRQYLTFYKDMKILDGNDDEEVLDKMERIQKEHPNWFKTLVRSIVLAFSGAYCITKKELFIYDEIASMNWIGHNKEKLLKKIQELIQEAIKRQIIEEKSEDSPNLIFENKGYIQKTINNLKKIINGNKKYLIDVNNVEAFDDFLINLKDVVGVVGFEIIEKFNELIQKINEKMENSITTIDDRPYVEIEKQIVDILYEKLEEKYKELQENSDNSFYYANVLESGATTIINLRDFLFNTMEEDESGKKAIDEMNTNIKTYQKYLSGYYAGVIAEKHNTPESFSSIKNTEGSYIDIKKIYDEIRSICGENSENVDEKNKEFKEYICNIVETVIEEYLHQIMQEVE